MGIMGFEGHVSMIEPREKRRVEIQRLERFLIDTKRLMKDSEMSAPEISTGSTGTYDVSGMTPEITEVQAGTYLLMDANYHRHVPEFDCALTVISTVISKPSDERAITDAGVMSISMAFGKPEIVGTDSIEVYDLHAENTVLKIRKPTRIEMGDKVELIPAYLDATVSRHNKLYGIRNGKVEIVWNTVGRATSN
jgi:D-serine deaminase-like pyridoxal phosphate-dependent protein